MKILGPEQAVFLPGDVPAGLLRSRPTGAEPDLVDLGYARLYVGDENRLDDLPSPRQVARLRKACTTRGVAMTLVTPALPGPDTGPIEPWLAAMQPGDEVVVNDPILLETVLRAGCLAVSGRRLARPDTPGFLRKELPGTAPGPASPPPGSRPCSLYLPLFPAGPGIDGAAVCALGGMLPRDLAALRVDRLVRTVRPAEWTWLTGRGLRSGWNAVHARRRKAMGLTPFVEPFEPALLEALAEQVDSVFELGCGTGTHLEAFAARGTKVAGIDASRVAIDTARRRLPSAALHLGDLLDAPVSGPFDLVLDLGTFHAIHPFRRDAFVRQALPLLSDRGMLLAFVFVRDPRLLPAEPVVLLGGRVPEWGFSPGELDALFAGGLVRTWTRDVPGDPQTPPKQLVLFARPGDGEDRARTVVRRLARPGTKTSGTPPPVSPEGQALDLAAWLDPQDSCALEALGARVSGAIEFPSGRVTLRVSVGKIAVRLDLTPAEQDAAHYRTVGRYHVGYWAPDVDLLVVDRTIEALQRTLARPLDSESR